MRNYMQIPLNFLLLTMLFGWSGQSNAQTSMLYPGDTLRVSAPAFIAGKPVGTLTDLRNDSLFIRVKNRLLAIPVGKITKLEVSRGKTSRSRQGALTGALVGGLALGVLGAADVSGDQDSWEVFTPEEAFATGVATGALLGAGIGAIIGSGLKTTRWVKAPLQNLILPKKPVAEQRKELPVKTISGPAPLSRQWRISANLATCSPGPAGDIERAMIRAGFGETMPGGFLGGPVEHPFSRTGYGKFGFPWTLSLQYRWKPAWEIGVLMSNTVIGGTFGYQKPSKYLEIEYRVFTVAPLLYFHPAGILRLGVGPALFRTNSQQNSGGETVQEYSHNQFGALLDVRLSYPEKTLLFVEVNVQYRLMNTVNIGPFTAGGGEKATLPAFKVDYSHSYFGIGLGLHF